LKERRGGGGGEDTGIWEGGLRKMGGI